ncbi:odorant receptor Or2-like isoform X1 [Bacillus rossius redtenbacheri]|uniref:odorant receptor Or2-like isoform X1 n=1 Tax=Bacillus rossius redtenbacheri TaxID=93214 RepID=UPI002FDD3B6E
MENFLFVLYLLGSGNLCALAYEVSKAPGFNHQMTSAGSYLMGMVFRLGVYCYYGSEITSESLKVGEALYFSDWLGAPMAFKQHCVLVIARSHRPVRFTAGKFGTLSLDTYSKIINTAYSYFMLLRKMQSV